MEKTSPFQFGFKAETCTGEAMLRLNLKMREFSKEDERSGILFIDFKKAFDSVDRAKLYVKLMNYGIEPRVINLIKAIHDN